MNCKNCNVTLAPESEFCNSCGGKVIRNRLTFRNLFEHISETFFNYDNKLLRTFIDLFRCPDQVIDSYVSGVRRRYVNPISFFGVSLTLSGLSLFIMKKYYMQYLDYSSLFKGEIFQDPEFQEQMSNSASMSFEYSSLINSALVPFLALVSFIVFYNRRYNLTEHIVIYLYSMSVSSILSVVFGLGVLAIIPESYILFILYFYIFMLVYNSYVLTRLFKLSALQLTLKIVLFFAIFFGFYIAIVIAVATIVIISKLIGV